MMEYIAYASIAYLLTQALVSLINLLSTSQLKAGGKAAGMDRISVLIPARDEERNIGHLLGDLAETGSEVVEILVYDDTSSDNTAPIIFEKASLDKRIRYLKGETLPSGWSGKNHACHQLAKHAVGDYLLFMDADVRITRNLIPDALLAIKRHGLALLSLFPVQDMKTLPEWLTVPLMNRILIGNLPLFLIWKSKLPAFSAANGQFMMFRSDAYKNHWFHQRFKNDKVEDIRIIREMKKLSYSVATLLSAGQIRCRMYRGFGEAMNGFAKNIHAFFGRNWLILFLYILLTTLGPIAVAVAFPLKALALYGLALILTHTVISLLSRQSVMANLVLLPLQQLVLVLLGLMSAYRHAFGRMTWKGRQI